MDSEAIDKNLSGLVARRAEASSESDTMNSENSDLGNELRQMERNINYYKTKLQSCRDRYENVEMGICDVKRFQQKALFELNNARMEEQNLQEHLEMIRLNHEACVEKSGGYEDLDEKVRVTISELTTQRSTLMEELVQMRKTTDINGKKLARVNTMIEEQEKKNAILLCELMKKSKEAAFIPLDTQKRINALLGHLKQDESNNATTNDTMQ